MLQPLGISAEAEAVYVALGPLPSASMAELARLTSATPEQVAENLEELRKLGLATDSSLGHWRAALARCGQSAQGATSVGDRARECGGRVAGEPLIGGRSVTGR